jgi:hypothetical protein
LFALPGAVLAQDQPVIVRPFQTIPDDFTLPPGEGEEETPPPPPREAQASPVVQPLPEPAQATRAAPVRAARPAPAPARSAAPASAPAPATQEPPAEAMEAPAQAAPAAPPVAAHPADAPGPNADAAPSGGFNWLLLGLFIMGTALLGLVVFLRRQSFDSLPGRAAPLDPARVSVEPSPPEPAREAMSPPPPVPPPPLPASGDGLVHARLPVSGLVTTNLAAKRRAQAVPAPRQPAVRTRIFFDGF